MFSRQQILKERTYSFCSYCLVKVPARVYIENSCVVMEKNCPQHGVLTSIIEKDQELYLNLYHKTIDKSEIARIDKCLTIPVEYRCDLNCLFCCLPNRTKKNIPLKDLQKIVSNFKGNYILLSGGEPTLRKDLFELIKMVKAESKKCYLVTDGLKLVDPAYVASLKNAGLDLISLSLYSLNDEVEKKICG